VGVGTGVKVAISVAVGVTVGVVVMVGVPRTGVAGFLPSMRITAKTNAAPTIKNNASKPSAAGSDNVISGIRLACTALGFFISAVGPSSVPQTRQRVAFSVNRVPQVGQIFVTGVDGVSGLIRGKIIPYPLFWNFFVSPREFLWRL